MSSIDPKIKSELDMRLAKGDLDVAGYQLVLKTLMQDAVDNFPEPTKNVPLLFSDLGSLLHAWRGINCWEYRLHRHYQSNPDVKNRLLWLGNALDYFITDEYLIVLSSSPETKVKRITDTVAAAGPIGALAGGLFISLPALLVGNAYEKIFGEKNHFNIEALSAIFNSGYAVYSKKSDLTFQSFTIKPGFLTCLPYKTVAIVGRFKSATVGDVELCFLLSENLGLDTIKVVKPLRAAECLVNEHPETLTSVDQVNDYFSSDFPKPVLGANVCPKCSHYREQKGWFKMSFISNRISGDCKRDSRPSNENLPCRIPVEASSAWDHYFSDVASNRKLFYPTNCHLFIPSKS